MPAPDLLLPSPLRVLDDDRIGGVRVLLKRDDLIHPQLSGNKWRKLKYLLPEIRRAGRTTVLTFGGAYSNHLRAVAAAGRAFGFATIGVVRGEERPYNRSLAAAEADGMRLHYLDRATYRRKGEPDVLAALHGELGEFAVIPEGGTTVHAIPGCRELVEEIDEPFDTILCAVGTGGTVAGLSAGLAPGQRALGISVLRGVPTLDADVAALQRAGLGRVLPNWTIDHRFHCGGFARRTPELDAFLDDVRGRHGLELDHVYVGKMMFALVRLIAAGRTGLTSRSRSTVPVVLTPAPTDRGLADAGERPWAGVDRESVVGPEPTAGHRAAGRIQHELHDPVVNGSVVVPVRCRPLGPGSGHDQTVCGEVQLDGAGRRGLAPARQPSVLHPEIDAMDALDLDRTAGAEVAVAALPNAC